MSFTWKVLRASDARVEVVEDYPTLEAALADLTSTAWESPPEWVNLVIDDKTGRTVAVAILGLRPELLVTLADGRHLVHPLPDHYRPASFDPSRNA